MSRGVRIGSSLSPQIHSSVSAPRRLCYAADRVGFEPTKRLPVYTLSRRVPSAARPPIPGQQLNTALLGARQGVPEKREPLRPAPYLPPIPSRIPVVVESAVGLTAKNDPTSR